MSNKYLTEFLSFLDKEGLLKKPLSFNEIIDKFQNKATASTNIKAPTGSAGFTTGKSEKKSTSGN